jgi:hypothetical protein
MQLLRLIKGLAHRDYHVEIVLVVVHVYVVDRVVRKVEPRVFEADEDACIKEAYNA